MLGKFFIHTTHAIPAKGIHHTEKFLTTNYAGEEVYVRRFILPFPTSLYIYSRKKRHNSTIIREGEYQIHLIREKQVFLKTPIGILIFPIRMELAKEEYPIYLTDKYLFVKTKSGMLLLPY